MFSRTVKMAAGLRALALALALLTPLAACEVKVAGDSHPPILFTDNAPMALDVARIEVVEQFKPPLTPPHIEHLAPVPPAHALRNWARDRLLAQGTGGVARFTIVDGSVTRQNLEKKTGLSGLVTTDQSLRYTVMMKVRVDVDAAAGQGFAEAMASRSQTVPENLSIAERDDILHALIAATAKSLDKELEREIRAHLGPFLR